MYKALPSEATFSRAFAEFAHSDLAHRTHAALIDATLGEQLIGHVSRDSTAIHARESVDYTASKKKQAPVPLTPIEAVCAVPTQPSVTEAVAQPIILAHTLPRDRSRKREMHVLLHSLGKIRYATATNIARDVGRHCPRDAILARKKMHKDSKKAGKVTSCILIQPIVACH